MRGDPVVGQGPVAVWRVEEAVDGRAEYALRAGQRNVGRVVDTDGLDAALLGIVLLRLRRQPETVATRTAERLVRIALDLLSPP